MPHNITGLDHTLVGVADLKASRKTYQNLGFTVTPRGSHIGWGTANYCIMLENDYIELLGIVDASKETNGLRELLDERGEGMLGMAFASDDPEQTVVLLAEADLNPVGPLDLCRKLELPEGDVLPEFKLIRFDTEGVPPQGLFICHHLTPDLIRKKEWEQHANGARYVHSIVVLVDNPTELVPYYSKLCGMLNVTLTDATLTVRVGRLNLTFVTEPDLDLLFPGLFIPADMPPFPHILSMTIAVENLAKTKTSLEHTSIPIQEVSGGVIRVQPAQASGVLLEFIEA